MTKLLLVLVIALSSLQVFATEVKLHESRVTGYGYYNFSSGAYGVNKDLGRAWLTLTFFDQDPESLPSDVRVLVEGLKYDKTTKEIIMESETGRIVCAYEKKFLGIKSLKLTGNCNFKTKTRVVQEDDGFEIKEVRYNSVYFVY